MYPCPEIGHATSGDDDAALGAVSDSIMPNAALRNEPADRIENARNVEEGSILLSDRLRNTAAITGSSESAEAENDDHKHRCERQSQSVAEDI